jgi:hypothetical protein
VAFSFSGLRKLRPWNCNGTLGLLHNIVDLQQVIRLTSQEIVMGPYNRPTLEDRQMGRFLQAFSDLENLYISLPIYEWNVIANSVVGHSSTLKRIVLPGRTTSINNGSDHFDEDEDAEVN